MKPHLPIFLRNLLFQSLRRVAHTTLCTGAVAIGSLAWSYADGDADAQTETGGDAGEQAVLPLGTEAQLSPPADAAPQEEEDDALSDEEKDTESSEDDSEEEGAAYKKHPIGESTLCSMWSSGSYPSDTTTDSDFSMDGVIFIERGWLELSGFWQYAPTVEDVWPQEEQHFIYSWRKVKGKSLYSEDEEEDDEEDEEKDKLPGSGTDSSTSGSSGSSSGSRSSSASAPAAPAAGGGGGGFSRARSVGSYRSAAAQSSVSSTSDTASSNKLTGNGVSGNSSTSTPSNGDSGNLGAPAADDAASSDDGGLVWQGNESGTWNADTENWTSDGTATAFTTGADVIFGETDGNKNVTISGNYSLSSMLVNAGGYSFGGSGGLNITGSLRIDIPDDLTEGVTTPTAEHSVSFGGNNTISAGDITMVSGLNTLTTFGGNVTADSLTITNCEVHDTQKAGSYVFEKNVTVKGDASITLGSDSGVSALQLLNVRGDFSAASLMLAGTATKAFGGTVTTTGDLTVQGHSGDSAEVDGTTIFSGDVTIGGTLYLLNNTEATFNANLVSAKGEGQLQTVLNQGTLHINTFVSSMQTGSPYDLGTITLQGQGGLTLAARTVTAVKVAGNGQAFTIGGAARQANISLITNNTGDFSVTGGNVNLSASGGQVGGTLSVSGGANLTLTTNNILADNSTGISVSGGSTLYLGHTQQNVWGTIALHSGIIEGEQDSALAIQGTDSRLTYTDGSNEIRGTIMQVGTNTLTIEAQNAELARSGQAAETPQASTDAANHLSITGDITGSGSLLFTGKGTTSLESALSYEGAVTVAGGTTLEIVNNEALAQADSLTIDEGGHLEITHGGLPVQMTGDITIDNGATLQFNNVIGHDKHEDALLVLTGGGLYFNGSPTFIFDQKLDNFTTYTLVSSDVSINLASGGSSGVEQIYMEGQLVERGQYEFTFLKDGVAADATRYLYFTTMYGRTWNGSAGDGKWETESNWTAGDNTARLFRETTAGNTVTITLNGEQKADGLFMDGGTNYTFTGTADSTLENTGVFIKRGTGTMEWNQVDITTSGDMKVEAGELKLTNGASLQTQHIKGGAGEATISINGGKLIIDASSRLLHEHEGETATISGHGDNNAELSGVNISGWNIAGIPNTQGTIKNAAIDGYTLGDLTLLGSGTLTNTTLTSGTQFGKGSAYTLSGHNRIESTLTNQGTLTLDAAKVVLDIGGVNSTTLSSTTYTDGNIKGYDGNGKPIYEQVPHTVHQTTYTIFSGGSYKVVNGTAGLTASNFLLYGTSLSKINNITFTNNHDGSITVSAPNVAFIEWDSLWDDTLGNSTKPIIAIEIQEGTAETIYVVSELRQYKYTEQVSGFGEDSDAGKTHVINLSPNSGGAEGNKTVSGIGGTGKEVSNIWINSERSLFGDFIGGNHVQYASHTGTVHMQLLGEHHKELKSVVAGSANGSQTGDTFLTFADSTYTDKNGMSVTSSGNYTNTVIVAGNYLYPSLQIPEAASTAVHKGNSTLHIAGGTFSEVFAGSFGSWTEGKSPGTEGNTSVLVDGGEVAILHAGDFTGVETTTHTGNVEVELKGGTLTHVYAAGGSRYESSDTTIQDNMNTVSGNATIHLYAGEDGKMLSQFQDNKTKGIEKYTEDRYGKEYEMTRVVETTITPLLYGGTSSVNGTSTLDFANAGEYELQGVTLDGFDTFTLATDAHAWVRTDRFNVNDDLTISGAGTVTVSGDEASMGTTAHNVTLTEGARLELATSHYQTSVNGEDGRSTITATAGTTIDASYEFRTGEDKNAMNVELELEGTGTDGKGALYVSKGNGQEVGTSYPAITLTGNALIGIESGHSLHMVTLVDLGDNKTKYEATTLDLSTKSPAGSRGFILTLSGGGTLGLYNTDVDGGTIDVVNGTLATNISSTGGNTDLVLRAGTTLDLTDKQDSYGYYGEEPNSSTTALSNGFAIETLSGSGAVNLNTYGWLYISMDRDESEGFAAGVDTSNLAGYARYSGKITGLGKVSKAGNGTQYFLGSDSTYLGGSSAAGGRLYLLGSSTAGTFTHETTTVNKGVIGTGDLSWEGGAVYLGDGVNIYNNGAAKGTADIILGVESRTDGTKTTYNVATYSGVLSGSSTLQKEGGGTLILTQDSDFTGAVVVKEGSLNLRHWANPGDYSSITVEEGATLVLTYDKSGGNEEITQFNRDIIIKGTGDKRWEDFGENTKTAALASALAAGKTLEIQGVIKDGTESLGTTHETTVSGNLLHSGSGTLILSGANTYSGGTTIDGGGIYLNGTVIVRNSKGLGATAKGGTANVVTEGSTRLVIDGTQTNVVLAAKTQAEEGTHAATEGNDIRGTVAINKGASLTMQGDGYYAVHTELESGSTLRFEEATSSNWDGEDDSAYSATATNSGAGSLAGNGTVEVNGAGTQVRFNSTASLHTGEHGFAGDMEVTGDNAQLRIASGALDGGNISVSGSGARLDAAQSDVYVSGSGKEISLTSTGKDAVLHAQSVDIRKGATLSVTGSGDTGGQEAAQIAEGTTTGDTGGTEDIISSGIWLIDYNGSYNAKTALNVSSSTSIEALNGLSLQGGSILELNGSNVDLEGNGLTLNVSGNIEGKIELNGTTLDAYLQTYNSERQLVLFSDVTSFKAVLSNTALVDIVLQTDMPTGLYVARASDFFTGLPEVTTFTEDADQYRTNDYVVVYDSSNKVVYLDRAKSITVNPLMIPEPGTVSLSLLALSFCALRRRRASSEGKR